MKIEAQKIIKDTYNSFTTSSQQRQKFSAINSYVNETDYKNLHTDFLTATSITIDIDLFIKEINQYNNHFYKWGQNHLELERFGLSLVNQNGKLHENDPINGSLHEWNKLNPHSPIIETDCRAITEAFNIKSLQPLKILDGHWCRSNVLKWNKGAHFKPHIDTIIPSPWLRLWATSNNTEFDINYDDGSGNLIKFNDIEPGRIYIIDTSKVHDAVSYTDNVYQLFLSVLPSAINILKEYVWQN